jgi:hypothetical protein
MYGVWCDILSKYGASHMHARATLSNGREPKRRAAERHVTLYNGVQKNSLSERNDDIDDGDDDYSRLVLGTV